MITQRNIILFASTIVFILINIFGTSLLIESKISKIKKLENDHRIANEKYITAQILSQRLKHVYNIFENNLAEKGKNDILNQASNVDFTNELSSLLLKHDITERQFQPGKKTTKGVYTKVTYTIEVECDYEKFGNFIVDLEKNNRIIEIENIYLKNDPEKIKLNENDDMSFLNTIITMKIHTVSLNKAKNL